MSDPARVIKRYSNRKLYDMRDSRYVTLHEVGEMVRAGEEVQILDHTTGEDKTEITLSQILSEDLRSVPHSIPLGALRGLIQSQGERLLSQLRDSPLGRLLPRDSLGDANAMGPASRDAVRGDAPPTETVEPTRPAAVPSIEAFEALQLEVRSLQRRMTRVEATLASRGDAAGVVTTECAEPQERSVITSSSR